MFTPLFTHLDGRIPIFAHDHMTVLYRAAAEGFRPASLLAEGPDRDDLCHYLATRAIALESSGRFDS